MLATLDVNFLILSQTLPGGPNFNLGRLSGPIRGYCLLPNQFASFCIYLSDLFQFKLMTIVVNKRRDEQEDAEEEGKPHHTSLSDGRESVLICGITFVL